MEQVFTDANFTEEVLKSDVPVFVDFWAIWCGPCHIMEPIVDDLVTKYAGRNIKIGKCNVDENPGTSTQYSILSIPTFTIFKNGEVADQIVGGVQKEKLQAMIEKYL